jgi:hypothetical protein
LDSNQRRRKANGWRREVWADARSALQSFRSGCSPRNVTASGRPQKTGCSFRVPDPVDYRVMALAIPLCRWPFPRLCGFRPPGCADQLSRISAPSRRVSPSSRVLPSLT